ncbi:MAG: DUF1311 domain-containing protein [Flavobacteriales bacterium]|nr:DUF1311 domain-containing protein [Flavobacteriales bacterium]
MLKRSIVFASTSLACAIADAQAPALHPIRRSIAQVPGGYHQPDHKGDERFAYVAMEAWDAEMKKDYQALLGLMKPEGQTALREAQRAWLIYRDKEFGRPMNCTCQRCKARCITSSPPTRTWNWSRPVHWN